MEKFIPYEKLSKKEKRKVDAAKRTTWGRINPVTRKPQNSKAYNRKRTQDWKKGLPDPVSFFIGSGQVPELAPPVCFVFLTIRECSRILRFVH